MKDLRGHGNMSCDDRRLGDGRPIGFEDLYARLMLRVSGWFQVICTIFGLDLENAISMASRKETRQ